MSGFARLAMVLGVLCTNLAASNIEFSVSTVGVNGSGDTVFRYLYLLSGLSLAQNQELDIRFDPSLYGTLSNGVAPAGFDLAVFQPGNPPGSFGDYSLLTLVNNPSTSGVFRVDFTFKGSGTPGAQPFFINQFDASGNFVRIVETGFTTPQGVDTQAPEPAGMALWGTALLIAAAAMRRRRRGIAVK
jgi:MYXO-CTERM domain-containing protein